MEVGKYRGWHFLSGGLSPTLYLKWLNLHYNTVCHILLCKSGVEKPKTSVITVVFTLTTLDLILSWSTLWGSKEPEFPQYYELL